MVIHERDSIFERVLLVAASKVGGQTNVVVGGDLTAKGAQIDLGQGGTIAAKGNVTLGAASATSTVKLM
ncbi:hypothetical protein [Burkholderia stagnalis]|uniref:hypothetical protein n=1 Tax=Burkholderia stagnalis TaxID=1503054 RepID=UPI000F55C7D8|nr:hypothetical protein [Burkholderia stagnalis]MDY7803489.1 hypothetical protein [Burkholderia stagnalis]